uniref:Uncharacterized protein n=1 Tax=Romanomermis culicivorax TaxID=13658 RepID=A0A915JDM0_ROMCU
MNDSFFLRSSTIVFSTPLPKVYKCDFLSVKYVSKDLSVCLAWCSCENRRRLKITSAGRNHWRPIDFFAGQQFQQFDSGYDNHLNEKQIETRAQNL